MCVCVLVGGRGVGRRGFHEFFSGFPLSLQYNKSEKMNRVQYNICIVHCIFAPHSKIAQIIYEDFCSEKLQNVLF